MDRINSIGKEIAIKIMRNELSRNSFESDPMSINIRLSNDDISLLDILARLTKSSRSAILSCLMEQITSDLFFSLRNEDKVRLAVKVDKEISENNIKHAYKEKSWVWEVSKLDKYALHDPYNKSIVKL